MFGNHELWKYGCIDCESCIYYQDKVFCKRQSRTCNFKPTNWNTYLNIVINNLRLTIEPITRQNRLYRLGHYEQNTDNFSEVYTADMYYTQLINDSLHLIRSGHCAYVFSLSHIIDILKFEPYVRIYYDEESNSFSVWKPTKKRNV